jgi:hypothetical protein
MIKMNTYVRITVFWDVVPCTLIEVYHFRCAYPSIIRVVVVMMTEAVRTSET